MKARGRMHVVFCTIWYHFHDLKKVKNTHGRVLLLRLILLHFLNFGNGTKLHKTSHVSFSQATKFRSLVMLWANFPCSHLFNLTMETAEWYVQSSQCMLIKVRQQSYLWKVKLMTSFWCFGGSSAPAFFQIFCNCFSRKNHRLEKHLSTTKKEL